MTTTKKRKSDENKKESTTKVVTSKYFSIESYFKSPQPPPKRPRADEEFLEKSKKEQCPLCEAYILVESISMQVHVNACLDSQQQKEAETTSTTIMAATTSATTTQQPDTWKSLFSASSSTAVTEIKVDGKAISEAITAKLVESKVIETKTPESKEIETSIIPKKPLNGQNVNTATANSTRRSVPFYKRMRDTRFTVDAFNFGKISECDCYFLSHYHSDHYGGLTSKWSHGPIYCSQITANLVKQELRVADKYIVAIPMNVEYTIPNSTVVVTLLDANHCPGSVLFLFEVVVNGVKKRHLHTGDFRAAPKMCLHEKIKDQVLNSVYLDTTYMSPKYSFPAQEECIQMSLDIVTEEMKQKKPTMAMLDSWLGFGKKQQKVLIVVGTYTIGKEKIFINIAKMLKCKIYATHKKKKILRCLENEELNAMLTHDPLEAQVHVVSLRELKQDNMIEYLNKYKTKFTKLIGFKPTGWTYRAAKEESTEMKLAPLSHIVEPPANRKLDIKPYNNHASVKLYGIPYSEHSSFRELASFIASLDIQHIIPTVNTQQSSEMSNCYFNPWQQEKLSKRIGVVSYPNVNYW